ncbi:MAG TPA: ABC transporter permease subunit [Sandaracinaceae bacterium]
MQTMLTIAGRQFRSYFNGPAAYLVAIVGLAFSGAVFWIRFFLIGHASCRDLFIWTAAFMTFAAPAISMGVVAEERRSGTMELLITMPVRELDVVVGKYLGALAMVIVMLALTIVHPIAVSTLGDMAWGPVVGGYVGLLLASAAMLAIGTMASTWTDNQLIAFFVALLVLVLFFWVPLLFGQFVSGGAAVVMQTVSFLHHLESMAKGVIDTRDLIFFTSIIVLCLMVAFRALERRRWS